MAFLSNRRAQPLLVNEEGSIDTFERIPFSEPLFDESYLQEVLEKNPDALPIRELEPSFGRSICIGREVKTGAGNLDNLYISATGDITLVETKLWRNPEARRKVVAQIIDYTRKISTWGYSEFEDSVRPYLRKKPDWNLNLYDWLSKQLDGSITTKDEFIDQVSDNLKNGRFLLLIVGDAIRKNLEDIVSYLQETPNLRFRLALVEIGCYRPIGKQHPLLLVPRVVVKTKQVERAIIRIEMSDEAEKKAKVTTTGPTTEEGFFEKLRTSAGPTEPLIRQYVKHVRSQFDAVDLTLAQGKLIVRMKFLVEGQAGYIRLLILSTKGRVGLGGKHLWKKGEPLLRESIEAFWDDMGNVDQAIKPKVTEDGGRSFPSVAVDQLVPKFDEVTKAISRFVDAVGAGTNDE